MYEVLCSGKDVESCLRCEKNAVQLRENEERYPLERHAIFIWQKPNNCVDNVEESVAPDLVPLVLESDYERQSFLHGDDFIGRSTPSEVSSYHVENIIDK